DVPPYELDPSFYVDWHDAREYSIGDIGVGECAGGVVSLTQFNLALAESKVFDASVLLDSNADAGVADAARLAYEAMVAAAQGLLMVRNPDASSNPDVVFEEFKREFLDTQLFFERFIGANEAQYYVAAHQAGGAVR